MRRAYTAFAIVLAAAAWAIAAAITQVSPGAATVGTHIVVDGDGFGTGRAPHVALKGAGTTIPLRVVASSDSQVTAEVRRGAPGTYDVVVRPAGRRSAAITAPAAVDLVAARVDSITPPNPAAGGEITITGSYFGTKTGRVLVARRRAKVVSWTDAEIHALVPKRTANGPQTVEIVNRIGAVVVTGALDVGGYVPVPITAQVRARLQYELFYSTNGSVHVTAQDAGFKIVALLVAPGGVTTMTIDLSNVDAANAPPSQSVEPALFEVTHLPRESPPSTWRAASGGISLTLEKLADGHFRGTFSGSLPRVSGDDSRDPLPVADGTFLVEPP
jgi:hypothetical protein